MTLALFCCVRDALFEPGLSSIPSAATSQFLGRFTEPPYLHWHWATIIWRPMSHRVPISTEPCTTYLPTKSHCIVIPIIRILKCFLKILKIQTRSLLFREHNVLTFFLTFHPTGSGSASMGRRVGTCCSWCWCPGWRGSGCTGLPPQQACVHRYTDTIRIMPDHGVKSVASPLGGS